MRKPDAKEKSPYPPYNVSVNYYTDPIYSSDAFYGFIDETCEKEDEPPDEPVESWGWINNVNKKPGT